ncbi:hypothetical protein ACFL3V_00395 [Nanoarchaeota archaeon]
MDNIDDIIERIELDIPSPAESSHNKYKGQTYLLSSCPTSDLVKDLVNDKQPIRHILNTSNPLFDMINIFYWDGTPEEFLEPLVFHELREAEERYGKGSSLDEAHRIARKDHMKYARKFLDKPTYNRFVEWQKGLTEDQRGA